MNKDSFLLLLQQPSDISPAETEALEEIVKNYPYFQLAHFLIARAHQQKESAQVSEKVKKAAVYAVNRNALKKFLFAKAGPVETKTSTPAETTSHVTYTTETEPVETLSEPVFPLETAVVPFFEQEQLQSTTQPSQEPVSEPTSSNLPEESSMTNIGRVNKTLQNEIIDSFIKKEPRITSLQRSDKDIPQTSQDLSEKSIVLPSGIISENLAGIMVKQGKTDKAIDIYEKLILKYPQKKAYFASKIEELKKS